MGTGMVFWLQASQFQMCMSVPQMADVWMRISTSLGPMAGWARPPSTDPGSRLLLTNAFMCLLPRIGLLDDAQGAAHLGERLDGGVDVGGVWAADIWVRMRAWPLGTTGKKKPVT